MTEIYSQFYILSYFDLEKVTSLSQILHVFHAKRTPSMFYVIEKNNWHHGFGLNQRMKREELEEYIQKLQKINFIEEEGKGYRLTSIGEQECRRYFATHYYPNKIKTFNYANVREPFWNRLQLFSQVFSELSYENTQYVPIIKHPPHQENVRQLFQQFRSEKKKILEQWIKEQHFLFSKLEAKEANILASQLTGHGIIGETKPQITKELQMETSEFYFLFQDILEKLILAVEQYQTELQLTNAILKQIIETESLGLSASTNHSYQLLKEGYSLKKIADIRSIKENTVREHVLEMAFVLRSFPYQEFIPKKIYKSLQQRFKSEPDYSYRQAKEEIPELEFMYFRLAELERIRMNDADN